MLIIFRIFKGIKLKFCYICELKYSFTIKITYIFKNVRIKIIFCRVGSYLPFGAVLLEGDVVNILILILGLFDKN